MFSSWFHIYSRCFESFDRDFDTGRELRLVEERFGELRGFTTFVDGRTEFLEDVQNHDF